MSTTNEILKGVRVLAWVWTGVFLVPAVGSAFASAAALRQCVHAGFGPPTGGRLVAALATLLVFVCLVTLGLVVIRTTTAALKRPSEADPRHGFDLAAGAAQASIPDVKG